MNVLIPTEPCDTHTILVQLALEQLGHLVSPLFTADQPTQQKNSVYIDNETYQWKSSDSHESISDIHYDVVWWRRARKPFIPKAMTHPDDYLFILRENKLFHESFTANLSPNAWWINSKEAANRANYKLLQLKLASECGLTIPTTLCSNDPKDIRHFLLKHDEEGVIYKPICSNFWFEEQRLKISYTSKITFLELPCNKILQLTPGLYQKEVKKKYELRVTCFGDYLVAAKLNSQTHPEGSIDWRAIPAGQMTIEPYILPTEVETKIRTLMQQLGIVFGSFDFIVTPDGDYVFLEVNEQGQFLWIEEYNPEFKMLDIFIQFLLNQSAHFQWQPDSFEHSIERYRRQMRRILIKNKQRHIDLNCAKNHNR